MSEKGSGGGGEHAKRTTVESRTNRPRLKLGPHLMPGVAALALFVVMAVVFLQASFGTPQGFPDDASVTASLGYAMFNIDQGIPSEGFLVAFIVIAIVLDVAIDGAIFLAKREEGGNIVTALTDGGRDRPLGDGRGRADDAHDDASAESRRGDR